VFSFETKQANLVVNYLFDSERVSSETLTDMEHPVPF